jgi:hypothetical protein
MCPHRCDDTTDHHAACVWKETGGKAVKLRQDAELHARIEEENRHLNECEDPGCPCWQGEAVGWFELV